MGSIAGRTCRPLVRNDGPTCNTHCIDRAMHSVAGAGEGVGPPDQGPLEGEREQCVYVCALHHKAACAPQPCLIKAHYVAYIFPSDYTQGIDHQSAVCVTAPVIITGRQLRAIIAPVLRGVGAPSHILMGVNRAGGGGVG